MLIKDGSHQIKKEQVIRVTEWDQEVKGYVGMVQFEKDGKTYGPYITKSELAELKSLGFVPERIEALKYSGTY